MTPSNLHTEILDNLTTAILMVEPDLSVSYLNSAAEALLETSGNRVIGEPLENLFYEPDAERSSILSNIREGIAFTKRETQLALPSGNAVTVDCAVTPLETRESADVMVIEIQPMDRLLRISRDEGILSAQQNYQALVRGLAHEIKNPLGGLRGAAQLLAKELPNSSLIDYTDVIIEEADRLSKLVDSMLGSHKLMEVRSINIHEVLERVRKLISVGSGGHIEIDRDYDPSIPEIMGDKERLIQAVLNIVGNAHEAVIEAGVKNPRISIRTRALRQFTIGNTRHRLVCKIEITDNGPGIKEELMDILFLPMVSGRANGTGLGLSISQSIINHHKGLIECSSRPGRTTFAIYIPIAESIMELQQ